MSKSTRGIRIPIGKRSGWFPGILVVRVVPLEGRKRATRPRSLTALILKAAVEI